MGIDLPNQHIRKRQRTVPKSDNVYLRLLVKLYRFLSRRTNSKFNKLILKRLCFSRTSKPVISVSRVKRFMKNKENKIAVVVSTVTDDKRIQKLPKLKICALKFTEAARARILAAGGECLTFDKLALISPRGSNTVLLRGRRKARSSYKYFGVPGSKNSKTRPHTRDNGGVYERARGRRSGCGFRV
eukprot:TRINITY_DN512_c1_g2_i1.p1 TRINITY_DN512_c1_g2~~TRINITY_DN512_c1_g2_i1.p1  ORF type:complete len:186 (-),score=83.77 TRINITY_DN512_c1_g2_i1:144-701(-)